MTTSNRRAQLGQTGESLARAFLERQGYSFVAQNWRRPSGELDLIMRDGEELVFVEVKARRGEGSGRAEEAISPTKAAKLLATADWFIAEHDAYHETIWRCDIVAITWRRSGPPVITHYVNAILTG